MQRSLVAFLNHGVLPFVGRTAELERIRSFWNATAEAPGLRVLLLVGEAGIGKSRLIEESTRSIAASGGAVVNIKLYPDAATSLAPLLARALARCAAAQHLLKSEPEENIPSILSALSRICGLRPTILVVEDLHLLGGDALAEFATLLDHLSDEPLSLLASARPADGRGRGVLERYLVEEIELEGLGGEAIDRICRSVFGEELPAEIIDALRQKTLGNAMALRSALRAGLKSGSFTVNQRGRVASPRVDQESFVEELERNVRLLSEGMAAHLSDRERSAARALARLGEVFARETAEAVLDNATQMIELLTFKGVIHTSAGTPAPLPGESSASLPFAFTHTLLHRHFIDGVETDPAGLVEVIASNRPLYSLLPFLLLDREVPATVPAPSLDAAIDRTLRVTIALDAGPDWRQATAVWRAAAMMADTLRPQLDEAGRAELDVRLMLRQLGLMRREQTGDFPRLVEHLMELTAAPSDATWGAYRLRTLVYLRRHLRTQDPAAARAVGQQVDEIIERFPSTRFSPPYVSHLRETVRVAVAEGNIEQQRLAESRLKEILESDEATEEIRRYAHTLISPYLVTLFDSPEELSRRLATLAELEASAVRTEPELLMWKIGLYYTIGHLRQALEVAEASLEAFTERGLAREVASSRLIALFSRLLLGESTEEISRLIEETYRSTPPRLKGTIDQVAVSHFATAGLFLNDLAWTERVIGTLPDSAAHLAPAPAILLALRAGRTDSLPPTIQVIEPHDGIIRDLLAVVHDTCEDGDGALGRAAEFLARPTLRLDEALATYVTLELVALLRSRREDGELLRAECRGAVLSLIDWLAGRLPLVALRALDSYGEYLTRQELRGWRSRLEALVDGAEPMPPAEAKIALSMFGSIAVKQPGGEIERVRGGQLCSLLGLMVADRLLREPLSQSEFTAIAMGTERDPESVRKSMNFAVFRLRELLGGEAISTDGPTPALNFDLVEVDLVEAHERLQAASEAIRDGALLRAVPELMAALEISAGQVPFPTLYDEFFEAAREDFESELRAVTLRVARALAREEDHDAAERVLSRAFAAMPDDEELAELLQESLVALGKRTEARRVGMRAAELFE